MRISDWSSDVCSSDRDQALEAATIGFGGLGGGGSHAVQQAAHLGIGNFVLVDPDAIEDSNLNRLVGGTALDVKRGTSKVEIAKRLILAINPRANVVMRQSTWQEEIEPLKRCDIIIGGQIGRASCRESGCQSV